MADYFPKEEGPKDMPLPAGCLLPGPIPDPRSKRPLTMSEREHPADFHSTYGGSMNIGWFNRLNLPLAVQNLLCYPESCLIVNEDGDTVGKMFTSLMPSAWGEQQCLMLHAGSHAKIRPGVEVGTSLTGFLTPKFRVIQELCHEWCRYEGVTFDRKTFLMQEQNQNVLFCRMILKRDDVVKMERSFKIGYVDLQTFLSEAASILLQRLIIQQKKTGEVTLKALTNHGNMVQANYRVLGTGYENVKGEDIRVWGVRRTVWGEKGIHCWDSLFNYYGRLVLRCQPENEHAMVPLWFKPIDEYDAFGEFIGMRPPMIWACDPELHSKYLIRKTELAGEYKTYLMDHPEVRALLSDFMQKLLLSKPRNILEFAKQFFTPFLIYRPESEDGFERAKSVSSSSSEGSMGEGGEGDWGEGYEGGRKKYGFLHMTSRPYKIEDYFTEGPNEDGFLLPPREMNVSQDDLTQ